MHKGLFERPTMAMGCWPLKVFYVDGISDVENLGAYFKTTYFTRLRPESLGRISVVSLIRPKLSLLTANGGIAQWLKRQSDLRSLDG